MARPSLGKLVGIGGCLVIGLAGGLAVRAVANVEPPSSGPPERAPSDGQLRAASVSGDVKVLARTGVWRPARKDDVVRRPTGFEVDVGASNINLVGPDVSITALNGARGLINGLGQPLRVYLRDGLAVVQSPKEQVTVIVESDDSEITGRSFGVRVDDGRVLVSAIGREVEVRRKGQIHRFPEGSEAILSSLGFRQVPLALELAVQIESAQRVGDRWQVRGRTSATATALVAVGSRYARVPVEPDGRFTANIAEQQPRPGELIVQDSAGREAEVGRPSGAIDAGRAARRRATVGSAASEPDALFPDDAPPAAPAGGEAAGAADPAAEPRASAAPTATAKPAGGGGGGGGGGKRPAGKRPGGKAGGEDGEGGDSITLGDFAEPADPSAEPEPKSVELPKTETPPKVEGAGRKAEKPAPKPAEDEGDEEVQLNW
jgi:hypothetical protein